MAAPDLALQKALVAAIKAAVTGAGSRVHDRAPQSVQFPWVQVDCNQIVPDGAECLDGLSVYADVHVWSRADGTVEGRTIAEAIRQVLDDAALTLDSPYALVSIRHQLTRVLRDPDGLTTHAVLNFEAMIEA